MCTSLRGAAFFGASIHIAVGLLLFSRYVIATVVFTFYNFNDLFSEKVTTFLAPFMIYVTLLLALGLLIFHSVEKEYFFLLKWSSVAFSLLQLAVFVTILLLKLSPNYQYHQFPFLPESLTNGYPPSTSPDSVPAGPGTGILTVPHGAILTEKDKSTKSSDPPDPGGGGHGSGGHHGSSTSSASSEGEVRWREGILLEIQRLSILISCVLLTLVYLLFLFLYIRQLNYEDTGHVFGHAQAITRNIAFYVQPQFTQGQQGINNDNNKLIGQGQVQRSQTQIPQQFLPQQRQQQQLQMINQSPKKVPPLHQNQVQSTSILQGQGNPSNPGELTEVQGSPARQAQGQRGQLQQSQHNQPQGNFSLMNQPVNKLVGQQLPPLQQQQIRGGGGGILSGSSGSGGQVVMLDSPAGQQGQNLTLGQRGPIPAQVRINFYPKDLMRQNPDGISPVELPHNNVRPKGLLPSIVGGGEAELRVEESPLHHPRNPQIPPGHLQGQQVIGQHVHGQIPIGPVHLQGPQPIGQHMQGQHIQGQQTQSLGPHPQGHQHQLGPQPLGQHQQHGPQTLGQHQQHGPQPLGQHQIDPQPLGHLQLGPQPLGGQHQLGPQPLGQHQQHGPQPMGQHQQHGPQPMGKHQHHGPQPMGQHQQHGPQPMGHHQQHGPQLQPLAPQHHQGPHLQGQHLQGQVPLGQHVQGQHVHGGGHPLAHQQGHHQFQRLQHQQQYGNPHQQQQQFLHHSYPNQSDSASPASSVAYSPNPPRGKQHPISMV